MSTIVAVIENGVCHFMQVEGKEVKEFAQVRIRAGFNTAEAADLALKLTEVLEAFPAEEPAPIKVKAIKPLPDKDLPKKKRVRNGEGGRAAVLKWAEMRGTSFKAADVLEAFPALETIAKAGSRLHHLHIAGKITRLGLGVYAANVHVPPRLPRVVEEADADYYVQHSESEGSQ